MRVELELYDEEYPFLLLFPETVEEAMEMANKLAQKDRAAFKSIYPVNIKKFSPNRESDIKQMYCWRIKLAKETKK